MKPETKTINGRVITYSDVIHHDTHTVFGFMDRVRILFGKKATISSELYTKEEVNVLACEVKSYCQPIFKKRRKVFVSVDNKNPINATN